MIKPLVLTRKRRLNIHKSKYENWTKKEIIAIYQENLINMVIIGMILATISIGLLILLIKD